jgi:hypothetical protein
MLYHLRHSTSPDIGKSNTTTGGKYISKNAKVLLLRKNVKIIYIRTPGRLTRVCMKAEGKEE